MAGMATKVSEVKMARWERRYVVACGGVWYATKRRAHNRAVRREGRDACRSAMIGGADA